MKILLIYPTCDEPPLKRKGKLLSFAPSLGLAQLAALTPPEFEVALVDELFENINYDGQFDLVGISTMTSTAPRAYAIAERFRQHGTTVVLGGIHPTTLPEEAAAHCDAVVVGEAEGVWDRLLVDFQQGRMQRFYHAEGFPDLNNLAFPRRELFHKPNYRYLIANSIQTTRGCPFNCGYCTVTRFFGHSYRQRPIGEIIRELAALKEKLILFVDDNIVGQLRRAKELFRALRPLGLRWVSQASITMAKDEELLRLMADSGCTGVIIGFESLSAENLKHVGKHFNIVNEFEEAIKRIRSYGLAVFGAFMFGFDQDDESVFERTLEFAQRNRLEGVNFSIVTPLPGTQLHTEFERDGRIIDRDWSHYDVAHVVFRPWLMSPERLAEGFIWALEQFYSLSSILKRIGLFHRLAPLYWLFNLSMRRGAKYWSQQSLLPSTIQLDEAIG
ncbi:MAG: B12-binding domain-containing radical SAM protein [Chloroflexi bacterium]|nr:B12-binding domain-containing radical SAM protein [Chloroflexota bacterium]